MASVAGLDEFVKEIEEEDLVDKSIQLVFSKGASTKVPKTVKKDELRWGEITDALCGKEFYYNTDKLSIYVVQHTLGGYSVKVYSNNPLKLVFQVEAVEFSPGFAPVLNKQYKLKHCEQGDWINNLKRTIKKYVH